MATYTLAPNIGKPIPLHQQLETERRAAYIPLRRPEPVEYDIVTELPKPYLGGPPLNATRLLASAKAAGMVAQLRELFDGCVVEGYDAEAGIGFRARWTRGRAIGGTWHERAWRWGMTYDERPGPDATVERRVKGKLTRVPAPNRMPRGLDREHLKLLGGPHGVEVGVTAISARLKAMAAPRL